MLDKEEQIIWNIWTEFSEELMLTEWYFGKQNGKNRWHSGHYLVYVVPHCFILPTALDEFTQHEYGWKSLDYIALSQRGS